MAHAGQSSTYVAFGLSIQYPIPGRICSIQPIPCCLLLYPAMPGPRAYPILNLESNLCRHLSYWLLKVLADERHPQNAPLSCLSHLFTALMAFFCFNMMQYLGLLDLLSRPSLIAFIFQALSLPCLLRCVNPPIFTLFLA